MATPLRVLLVEDEETDALLLLRALKKGGYDVTHTRVQTEADMRAELTLVLPGASLEIARDRAEHLRVGVQSLVVRFADRPLEAVTLSLGVAVLPQHGETAEAILQAADAALYRAKQGGRNRVEVAA